MFYITTWLQAARPKTLVAAVSPLLLSQVLAWRFQAEFSFLLALIILICGILLQISANLANDYFDFVKGIDNDERLGPARVTQQGLVSAEQIKVAISICLSGACLSGLYLVWSSGWVLLLLGLICVIAALAYSGGRYSLASLGLGEISVFIFFGWVAVAGGYYVQAGSLPLWICIPGSQMGFLAAAIMLVNNIRDYSSDKAAGKNTLIVRLEKPSRGKKLYCLALVLSLICLAIFYVVLELVPVLGWLLIPLTGRVMARVFRCKGQEFNQLLAQTAQLMLWSSVLLCIDVTW